MIDAPLSSSGSISITGIEGITTGPKLIATFTDANPFATVADYTTGGGSVVVNWGDGSAPETLPASAITLNGLAQRRALFSRDGGPYLSRGGELPDLDRHHGRRRLRPPSPTPVR